MNDVLIVDDHLLLSQLVAHHLQGEGLSCAVADVGADFDELGRTRYRLILLDLEVGAGRPIGLELITPLMAAGSPLLVMTGATDDLRIAEAVDRGATGVFQKNDGLDVLFSFVRAALADEPLPPHDEERRRLATVLEQARPQTNDSDTATHPLSAREGEVLWHLADGLTVSEISERTGTSILTVRSHVKAIHRKLGVNDQLRAVAMMREANWTPA